MIGFAVQVEDRVGLIDRRSVLGALAQFGDERLDRLPVEAQALGLLQDLGNIRHALVSFLAQAEDPIDVAGDLLGGCAVGDVGNAHAAAPTGSAALSVASVFAGTTGAKFAAVTGFPSAFANSSSFGTCQ